MASPGYMGADKETRLSLNFFSYNTFSISYETPWHSIMMSHCSKLTKKRPLITPSFGCAFYFFKTLLLQSSRLYNTYFRSRRTDRFFDNWIPTVCSQCQDFLLTFSQESAFFQTTVSRHRIAQLMPRREKLLSYRTFNWLDSTTDY